VQNPDQHKTPLTARTSRRWALARVFDFRGRGYRRRACYRVKAGSGVTELSITACRKSYARANSF